MTKMARTQKHKTTQRHVEHQDATYIQNFYLFSFVVSLLNFIVLENVKLQSLKIGL